MNGGERIQKNLTEIIWKLKNNESPDEDDKKIIKRITDGYEFKEYNLTEEKSVDNWFKSDDVKYFQNVKEKVTKGNKGVKNVQHDNIMAEPTKVRSIIKILQLAKSDIPENEINKGLEKNTIPPKSGSPPGRPQRPNTPQLQASSSSNTTIDELLKDMEEFQSSTLSPLVTKSSKTLVDVTNYINQLLQDIQTGKVDSDNITKELKAQNDLLQEQIETLTNEKNELQKKIGEQTLKSGETAQQILDLQNVIEQKIQEVKEKEEINKTLAEDKSQNQIQSAEQVATLQSDLNNLTTDKRELTQKLDQQTKEINEMKSELSKVAKIKEYFEGIKQQTTSLVEHNDSIKKYIEDKNRQNGGYQYKSKNKSRSRRRYKGNRFGLLKSKSKTKKGKKKLKKKNKNIKGGMKTRTKSKRKSKKGKKTRKGKKKNNKRK